MAKLRLTIGKIAVATEKETAIIPFPMDDFRVQNYLVCLVDFRFTKKMYQPVEVLADLQISRTTGLNGDWQPISRKNVEKIFKHKRVALEVLSHDEGTDKDSSNQVIDTIGDDYYVQEVRPCYKSDHMVLKLKIYSLDKLLTLSHYCRSWTAKKLDSHILQSELPNYKLPYNEDEHVECDASGMKHLVKDHQEHIFPYLVQYNECFYDLLIRTCNRWGEFVYWEDGKLRIGYDDSKEHVKSISGYHSITYHDYASVQPVKADSTYVSEAPYDNNVLNSMVKKDGAARVSGTIKNMADMNAGADFYWLQKVGQVLTNNKTIMNFLFETAVNDLIVWAQKEALVSQYNEKHNDAYFGKKKKYISMLDEQYDDGKKTLNQFSEARPIVSAKDYAEILAGEMTAEQNTIDIDYNTTWPGLKLGNIINVNDEDFIVVEIASDAGGNDNAQRFHVVAIAKDGDVFYPTMIPSGHIRQSGPQVAVVVDADDPNKSNRVRVKYPWQLSSLNPAYEAIRASDLKNHDVSDATPWLVFVASSGPERAGVHGRHYLAEKVLVNYANNNVERPFVVGAVSTSIPPGLKTGSAVLQAPNGEYIKVHEGTGKGATAFMANFTPGLSLVNGFLDFPDLFGDNEMSKAFEGGVELGDKYGVWNIKCSTDARSIAINSRWGEVKINAFTGISINAPNGDIRIRGKNVSIEAGNNLKLTSGTNIRNKFISTYGDGAAFNAVSFWYDVENMVAKKLASMVESVFDLGLIRSLIEVYWRPQEGALTIQSNRYLKLGAGGARPGYPDAAYRNPKKKAQQTIEKSGVLEMGPVMVELLSKIPLIVGKMVSNYSQHYNTCVTKKDEFDNAIDSLCAFSNGFGLDACKSYIDLQKKFWDPNTKEITEADLGFGADSKSDSIDDVDQTALDKVGEHDSFKSLLSKNSVDADKQVILAKRQELKSVLLAKANELLKSIAELRKEPQKIDDLTAFGIGRFLRSAPDGYYNAIKKAFSVEKCQDSAFYKFAYDEKGVVADERVNLGKNTPKKLNLYRKTLIRLVALNLVEDWGMAPQAIKFAIENNAIVETNMAATPAKPVTEDDLEDENKWNLYVRSLEFTKAISETGGGLLDAVASAFDPANLNLSTPIKEYYSWGNARSGQILFGTGTTLSMKSDGTISPLDASDNQGKLSKALLNGKEQGAYDSLNDQVRKRLVGIDGIADISKNLVNEFIPVGDDQGNNNGNNNQNGGV